MSINRKEKKVHRAQSEEVFSSDRLIQKRGEEGESTNAAVVRGKEKLICVYIGIS